MAGSAYLVGEQGPEIFAPGTSGSIIPNGRLGGGPSVTIGDTYIDARGATSDLIKVLPTILKEHGDRVKSEIIYGLQRRQFAL